MRRALVTLVVGLPLIACSIGETNFEEVTLPLQQASSVRTCSSPYADVDLSKLEACGDGIGKGHCYDGSKTPLDPAQLLPCNAPGEVCVPDKLLTAKGAKAKACTFYVGNAPGACVSLLLKQMNANKGALKQEGCDADERCAPCADPTHDGANTGVCDEAGVHESACSSAAGAAGESCCHGMGACMAESSVPDDQRDNMSREVCSEQKLCVPASMVSGNPKKCSTFLGFSGVCLDVCFATMLKATKPVLGGGDCGPTEVCLPCAIGKGQGMPGCE